MDYKEITKIKKEMSQEVYIKYLEKVIKILLKNEKRMSGLIDNLNKKIINMSKTREDFHKNFMIFTKHNKFTTPKSRAEIKEIRDYLEAFIKNHYNTSLHLIDISKHITTIRDFENGGRR